MEQIHEQKGHFVLTVKKNQPETYEEIHTFMNKDSQGNDVTPSREEFMKKGTVKGIGIICAFLCD